MSGRLAHAQRGPPPRRLTSGGRADRVVARPNPPAHPMDS
jgi:hypothetical protein